MVRTVRHIAAPALLSLFLAACATPGPRPTGPLASGPVPTVSVGIIAINDFHGALEPPRASVTTQLRGADGTSRQVAVPAGGSAWLASAVRQLQAAHPYHLTVSAGDLTSASQFASSIHMDEPAVGVANRLGLDFNAVGNHEFDRGWKELQRLQKGGCEKLTDMVPCRVEPFPGAKFTYLAANVTGPDGRTIFPATALRSFGTGRGAVKVGLVGLTLKGTAQLVSPDRTAGVTFGDEAAAINRGTAELKAAGADAVVVLIHQGEKTAGVQDPDTCDKSYGDLGGILDALDPRVDLVVSGHTHWAYVCQWPRPAGGTLLTTSAGVYGKLVTDITLVIDPAAHRVIASAAHNVIVQSEPYTGAGGPVALVPELPRFQPAADVSAFVGRYVAAAREFSDRVVGHLAGPAVKGEGAESARGGVLGHLIADAQLAATRGAGAQLALMNPFGLRASIVPKAGGAVTYGDVFQAEPFGNRLVTTSLTGAELKAVIEEGLDDSGPKQWLSPSAGFVYRWDMNRPAGDRVTTMTLDGKPIDPAATYRVTALNFLTQGGDGFTGFTAGRDQVIGKTDVDSLADWLAAVPMRAVPSEVREAPSVS